MIRKTIVAVIALIFLVMGLLNFYNTLFTSFFSSGVFLVRIIPLVGGALGFYAGVTMFRRYDFGRQLVVVLLFMRVFINGLYFLRMPKDKAWLAVQNHLGEVVLRIENPYAFQAFLVAWLGIALLAALFLLQSETKKLFKSEYETTKDAEPDIIFED